MYTLTVTWLAVATACFTLAAIHAHVWLRQRGARGNAAFALLAASVGVMATLEALMFNAGSVEDYARLLRWYQLPVWSGILATVVFLRSYLRAGRAWLGWLAVGLRSASLLIHLLAPPGLPFREITGLREVRLLGESVAYAVGVTNPWLVIGQLALLVTIAFVLDALVDLWRRGERRRALSICGTFALFVGTGMLIVVLSFWGLYGLPLVTTFMFAPTIAAMGFELSLDLINAVRVSQALALTERELRASEQRLALAADSADAGLWSIDLETGRMWATPRALAMFWLEPGREHDIAAVLARIHPEDRPRVEAALAGLGQAGARASAEYRVQGPDGEVRWYTSLGARQSQEVSGGQGATVMGATIDITERKRSEDEAARQRLLVEHLSRVATLSELSGTLAHEINQPLAIILSNAETAQTLLQRPAPDLGELRAMLQDIVEADERAGNVIRRLRSLLRRGPQTLESVQLNDVVEGVLEFMKADFIRRGVEVRTRLAPDLPPVPAARVALEQVFMNLLGNACDAVAGNPPDRRRVDIATGQETDGLYARVSDNGGGLPETAEQVFEPFYTTKTQGLGLGLAISRSIVEGMGGRLRAASAHGGGACFELSLPRGEHPP